MSLKATGHGESIAPATRQEHRLIYQVTNDAIVVLSCRDHY